MHLRATVEQCTELSAAQRIWEQLTSRRAPEDVKAAFPGFGAWASSERREHALPLLVARADGEPLALLPVRETIRRIRGIPLRILEAVGNDHWEIGIPVLGDDADVSMGALLAGLAQRGGWDWMEVGPMVEGSATFQLLLNHGHRLGMSPMIGWGDDDPIVTFAGGWEVYWSSRSGNLRSQVKRAEAKLRKQGQLAFEEFTGGPHLDDRLAEFFHVEASGWKGREGTAIRSDERIRRFYTDLAREAAARDWLRLHLLRLDGQCIAADYCLGYGGTVYMLKVGYDESFSACSPGQVIRKYALEHLFRLQRDQIYDMMPGGGNHRGYKPRWANQTRRSLVVRLFNPHSLRGRLAACGLWLRNKLKGSDAPAAVDAAGAGDHDEQ